MGEIENHLREQLLVPFPNVKGSIFLKKTQKYRCAGDVNVFNFARMVKRYTTIFFLCLANFVLVLHGLVPHNHIVPDKGQIEHHHVEGHHNGNHHSDFGMDLLLCLVPFLLRTNIRKLQAEEVRCDQDLV